MSDEIKQEPVVEAAKELSQEQLGEVNGGMTFREFAAMAAALALQTGPATTTTTKGGSTVKQ